MKHISNRLVYTSVIAVLLMLSLSGCAGSGIRIVAVPNQEVITLNPDEVVQIMLKVGFSGDQIEQYAWEVWDGLARSGEVRVIINDSVEAAFAVRNSRIYISSRSRGYFVFDVNEGTFLNMNNNAQSVPRR